MTLRPVLISFALLVPASVIAQTGELFEAGPSTLYGTAAVVEDTLQLTGPEAMQAGSIFRDQPICLDTFSTAFSFTISDPGNTGADGLALVITTDATREGDVGGGLGYMGLTPSLAVEFDTFQNGWDIDDNHVEVVLSQTGEPLWMASPLERSLEDGAPWFVWVTYSDGLIDVRWAATDDKPAILGLLYPVDLAQSLDSQTAFIGFTSATGAAWADHRLLSWSVDACSALLSKNYTLP